MRGHRRVAAVLASGALLALSPVLAVGPGSGAATAAEATDADFWSGAVALTGVGMFVPTAAALRAAGVDGLDLQMAIDTCPGTWSAVAEAPTPYGSAHPRRLRIEQAVSPCLGDLPSDGGIDRKPASIPVLGRAITVAYNGCALPPGEDSPAKETACPTRKRQYLAFGTLPRTAGLAPAGLTVISTGLTRAQVSGIIRSMRPATVPAGTTPARRPSTVPLTAGAQWAAAARAAASRTYAPSVPALAAIGLVEDGGPQDISLTTLACAGQWSVNASYVMGYPTTTAALSMLQSTPRCAPDPPGGTDITASPNTTQVAALGGTFEISYNGCDVGVGQPSPAEADCPLAQRYYSAGATLPAGGGKRGTTVQMDARGITRDALVSVIQSLRPVR